MRAGLGVHSIRTIPPKLCVGTREANPSSNLSGAADHLLSARVSRSSARFSRSDETFAGRASCASVSLAAPSHLRLLIVLELLVRRIIELQLLPRVMKVDTIAGPRARARALLASALRSCERSPPTRVPPANENEISERAPSKRHTFRGKPRYSRLVLPRTRRGSRTATVRSPFAFSPAIFRLPLARSAAALPPRGALVD